MTVAELEAGADETAPVPVAVATPPEPAPTSPAASAARPVRTFWP